jgi:uncharacterized membrane protein YgaE (UPF0421/DUF939 family)
MNSDKKNSTYMTLGTTLGMGIALIMTLLILVFKNAYIYYTPFIFIVLAFAFRLIGYGIDRFIDSKK